MKNIMIESIIYNELSDLSKEELELLDDDFLQEVLSNNDYYYLEEENDFFHEDDLVYCDHDNQYRLEYNTFYCEDTGQNYCNRQHDQIRVYPSRRYVCREATQDDYVWVQEDGEYFSRDSVYYWESDGEYHLEEENPRDEYNFEYHNSSPSDFSYGSKLTVGFEIEKEDRDAKESIYAYDLQENLGWGKEEDGSLDSDSGFELVSPIFNLENDVEYFENHFNQDGLKYLINADYSENCGGHINIKDSELDGIALFESIKGYIPLLYAIYPHRLNKNYCKAKKCEDLKGDREKYQAINIKHNGILEFRIFSSVKNVTNLLWRLKLVKLIMLERTSDFLEVVQKLANKESNLYKLFLEVYSEDRIFKKIYQVLDIIRLYEGINPSMEQMNEIEKTLKLK